MDWDQYLEKRKNRTYSFRPHLSGAFTNLILHTHVNSLKNIFGDGPTFFNKEEEFVATNLDEVLETALFSCVAIAFDLEALRNELYDQIEEETTRSIFDDLGRLFWEKDDPKQIFLTELIKEVFVVRDAVTHSHIQEVKVKFENFKPVKVSTHKINNYIHRQGDAKYSQSVSLRTKKTKVAKINTSLVKISYADVLKVLIVLDIVEKYAKEKFNFNGISISYSENGNSSLHDLEKEGEWGVYSFDLTFVILHLIRSIGTKDFVYKEIMEYVKLLQKNFIDIPHKPFKEYQLFNFTKWDRKNYLFDHSNHSSEM